MIHITDNYRIYVDAKGYYWEIPAWSTVTEPIGWYYDDEYGQDMPIWLNGQDEPAI